jgi:glucose-1-phosphate cytidylyltransferase
LKKCQIIDDRLNDELLKGEKMQVVILAGGLGTRLREETEFRPKPLVDVGGRPIIWHIMKIYAHYGFQNFIVCLGYRGNMIKEYFLNYEAMNNDFTICLGRKNTITYQEEHREQDFQVTLADTGAESLTGGRVKRIEKYIDGENFMVTYGDGVADVNLDKLMEFHKSHGKLATVTTFRPISRFGILDVDSEGQVREFAEKPQIDGWISVGYIIFNRRVFEYLGGDDCVLEQEPMQRLAAEGQLMAYRHEGFFFAMDTYREYKYLNELWDEGKAPWKVWQ